MEKSGQGFAINTIFFIVLGVVVAVVLIYGLSVGWGNFWNRGIGNREVNVDIVRISCDLECQSGKEHSYRNTKKDVVWVGEDGEKRSEEYNCCEFVFVSDDFGFGYDGCENLKCEGERLEEKRFFKYSSVEGEYTEDFFNGLTEEGKIAFVEQKKKEFDLPNEFCYWREMHEYYKDKCGFDDERIEFIFDSKKFNREKYTPDWATLNDDFDFCVPLIFDDEAWGRVVGGRRFSIPPRGCFDGYNIFMNPRSDWKKEDFFSTLYHEGLHSIQDEIRGDEYLGDGSMYVITDTISRGYKYLAVEMKDSCENVLEDYVEIFNGGVLENLDEEDLGKVYSVVVKTKEICNPGRDFIYEYPSYIERINFVIDFFEENKDYGDKEIRGLIAGIKADYEEANYIALESAEKKYYGKKDEIDTMLSEVQRWWLDYKDCEIIDTREEAEEAIGEFLEVDNLSEEYKFSREGLQKLMRRYRGTGYETDVYDALISRLQGLAMGEELEGDYIYV